MRARRRRHELAAAGASLSLGPPADDAEPLPPARANASTSAFGAAGVPSRLGGPRATAVPDASQPERSMASHASLMIVDATPNDAFSPSDPTAAGGAGGDGAAAKFKARGAPRPETTRRRRGKRAETNPRGFRAASGAHLSSPRGGRPPGMGRGLGTRGRRAPRGPSRASRDAGGVPGGKIRRRNLPREEDAPASRISA